MATLLILSGISDRMRNEYVKTLKNNYEILSRDAIRDNLFGKNAFITNKISEEVAKEFDFKLRKAYLCGLNVTINNTNSTERYIDKIIAECPTEYDIELKFFDISVIDAYFDNILKMVCGKRYIPFSILRKMLKSFSLINRDKYKQFAQII